MNWTIEMIEKAREIYQARHGGDYVENGEIFKHVLVALQEAAQQGMHPTAQQCDFTDCNEPVYSMLCKVHYYGLCSG